ncbi:MAG: sulfotransferase domain-containing protein [Actinomycetota bacterium]|nr:sulfotransferase domain-containing protein [Actinomycetota bacterium]
MAGALPTFVIIGAQKCGTTALHSYLARHPEISMSRPKELDFFVAGKRWDAGVDWYRSRFDPRFGIRGESSPNYTAHPTLDGVPERMASVIPGAKLIFMVRDPVKRVHSNYIHSFSNRAESRPIREAVLDPGRAYIHRSRYHHQLSRFLERYPMERILILEQDELRSERSETIKRVFRFVGASEDHWQPSYDLPKLETATRRRRSALGAYAAKKLKVRHFRKVRDRRPFSKPWEQPPLPDDLRAEIEGRLRDDIAAFRELTGRKFESWSI